MKAFSKCLVLLFFITGNCFAVPDNVNSAKVANSYPSFADVVEPLLPAVVNIYTEQIVKGNNLPQSPFFQEFRDLFKHLDIPFGFDDTYSNPKAVSLGSGFIIDSTGYIVTNYHVIQNAEKISVKLQNGKETEAKLIGTDAKTDLALLKISSKQSLPFVKFGDDQASRVGDWVVAIGNPFGLNHTVTKGIISSKARELDSDTNTIINNYIQTDAAINRGNSGGPLFNLQGEVIGVTSMIYSQSGVNSGIGFAIPAQVVKNVIQQLKTHGKINRGVLNISISSLTQDVAESLGINSPDQKGILVQEVKSLGAADKAGLKPGDVIIAFNNNTVSSPKELKAMVSNVEGKSKVSITVLRKGKKLDLYTTLDLDLMEDDAPNSYEPSNTGQEITIEGITFAKLKGFLVVAKVSRSGNWSRHIKVEDVLISFNQNEINEISKLKDAYNIAKQRGKNVLLVLKRENTSVLLSLPVSLK